MLAKAAKGSGPCHLDPGSRPWTPRRLSLMPGPPVRRQAGFGFIERRGRKFTDFSLNTWLGKSQTHGNNSKRPQNPGLADSQEKHTVARLIGAPPGYVGYEEGGLLTDAVRKQPHAVLLLDELEKAHPDLFGILLQVMDHAALTDSHGRSADFRHTVLVMTTNVGARELSARQVGFAEAGGRRSATGTIEKAFSPEFRNRLDAILQFAPLGRREMERVADKHLRELEEQLREKGVSLVCTPPARAWLAEKGYDPAFGARPMARLIERELRRPLAEAILFGPLAKGGTATVDLKDGRPCLSFG